MVSEHEHTLEPINDLVAPALSLITVNIPNDSLLEINKEVRNLPVIKEEDIKDEPPEEKVKINDETKDAVFEIKHEVSDDWNVFSLNIHAYHAGKQCLPSTMVFTIKWNKSLSFALVNNYQIICIMISQFRYLCFRVGKAIEPCGFFGLWGLV